MTELNLFWRPLLEDGSSAVICVGQPLRIYMFEGHRSAELNEKMVGTLTTPPASPEVRQNTPLTLSELRSAGERVLLRGRLPRVGPPGGVSGASQASRSR